MLIATYHRDLTRSLGFEGYSALRMMKEVVVTTGARL